MAKPPDLSRVRRIYVRAPNWVGDFVMATASFARLRAAFPQAHIVLGARPMMRELCSGAGWFDDFLPMPRAGGLRGLWRQVRAVAAQRFDLAVVLPNSLETGLVPFLARVPLRLGYRQGRPLLMNLGLRAATQRGLLAPRVGPRRVPVPMPRYYRALLDVLGIPGDGLHPELAVTDAEDAWVRAELTRLGVGGDERLLVIVVGANFGASKLWVPERFGEVARAFAARGLRPVLTVGPAEVELGRRIAAGAGDRAVGLFDPVWPLDKLKALVARAALMVTGDTGPRHLAVAFDRPVVCLMGPTDRRYTDYCTERTALIQKDLECVPCQRKVCPLGHHRCMKDITVDEVVAAGERLLGAR
ncbi:MAG: lipopolysaccharide heptosyltransferase II [Planctomycetota bacterium]